MEDGGGHHFLPVPRASVQTLTWLPVLLSWACAVLSVQAAPLASTVVDQSLTLGGSNGTFTTYTANRSPGTSAGPLLIVKSKATLSLRYAIIEDPVDASVESGLFQDGLLLPGTIQLEQGAGLVVHDVLVRTSCPYVHQLQRMACTQLSLQQRATLQIVRDTIMVPSWRTPQARLTNLFITCSPTLDPANPDLVPDSMPVGQPVNDPAIIPTMDCAVAWAHDWTGLMHHSAVLQTYANSVVMVVAANITIPWELPLGDIPVYRDMTVSSLPDLPWITYLDLGFTRKNATWTIVGKAFMTFQGLYFVTLPLGPLNKYPWSTQGWGMWMVNMERCISQATQHQQLLVLNCTLVMPSETLDYMSHWTDQVFSPFPDKRAAANWYSVDETCDPPINKTLLRSQVDLVSQWQWVTENATGFGVLFQQTTFTDKTPPGVTVTRSPLQLTKLFDKPYTPYDEIAWVDTPEQLIQQLANGTLNNILLLDNITLPANLWPPGGIIINRSDPVTIAGWPARSTVLDLQRAPRVMRLVSELNMRNLVLMNGAQDMGAAGLVAAASADDFDLSDAANLTFLQWSFEFDRRQAHLRLQNVLMLVPPTEYQFLIESVVRNTTSRQNLTLRAEAGGLSGSGWTSILIYDDTKMNIGGFVETGLIGSNVTVQSQTAIPNLPFPFMRVNWNVSAAQPHASSTPAPVTPPLIVEESREEPYWRPVVAIVVPVVVLVLLAAVATFLVYRRSLRAHAAAAGADVKLESTTGREMEAGMGGGPPSGSTVPDVGQISQDRLIVASRQGHSEVLSNGTTPSASHNNSQAYLGTPGPAPLAPGHPWMSGSPFLPPSSSTLPGGGSSHNTQTLAAIYDLAPSGSAGTSHAFRASIESGSKGPATAATSLEEFTFPVPGHAHLLAGDAYKASSSASSGNRTPFASSSSFKQTLHTPGSAVGTPSVLGQHHVSHVGGGASYGYTGHHVGDEFVDSFDLVPEHHEQLLINRIDLSRELQASIGAPDVASQLKSMVSNMQTELGDQEVEVTRVIGQGGGGIVYQGTWRGLTVAVKTLLFTAVPMQPMSRRQHRAMTEAAICNTLQHPNIVATYAYDLHALTSTSVGPQPGVSAAAQKSSPIASHASSTRHHKDSSEQAAKQGLGTEFKLYIIQEFCDGGTLKGAIEDTKLHDLSTGTPRPVMSHILQLATDIAAGMSHVHSRSVVHGDLTPANVLLKTAPTTESGYVAKVADFGLSWKLAHGQAHVSNARQGTSFYIAPEVLHVGIMSKAADVFSYGMVLHEMYHGRPVWRDLAKAATSTNPSYRRPGVEQLTWDPACPPDFQELVCACLASDPQARPSFFTVVEQLLLMQRQLYAVEEAAAAEAAAAVEATGEGGLIGIAFHDLSTGPQPAARTAQSGTLRSTSVNVYRASRQPTSGLLAEGDVQDLFRSMRGPLTSSNSAPPVPWIAPELVEELQLLEQDRQDEEQQQQQGGDCEGQQGGGVGQQVEGELALSFGRQQQQQVKSPDGGSTANTSRDQNTGHVTSSQPNGQATVHVALSQSNGLEPLHPR